MNAKLCIGTERPDPDALDMMRESPVSVQGTRWAAYQNQDMLSKGMGHLRFLAVGETTTYKNPPVRYPDIANKVVGHRYVLVGWVDLETGEIEEMPMKDEITALRRNLAQRINDTAADRRTLERRYGRVWNPQDLRHQFEIIGFAAPFVVVKRRLDGQVGTLMFQDTPRYYFLFETDEKWHPNT